MSQRLGQILLNSRLIDKHSFERALATAESQNKSFLGALNDLNVLSESDILNSLGQHFNIPVLDLNSVNFDLKCIDLVPLKQAQKYNFIPIQVRKDRLLIAISDPTNYTAIEEVKFLTGHNISVALASEKSIEQKLLQFYKEAEKKSYDSNFDQMVQNISSQNQLQIVEQEDEQDDLADLSKAADDAPVVKLCNAILLEAVKRQSSDIHIEPYEKDIRVRFRTDGVLQEVMSPPMHLKNAIVSRLKIMSQLNIAERRLPQDGRIKIIFNQKSVDFRVSILPTLYGEKVVLRILDKSNLDLNLNKLGFESNALLTFKNAIHNPNGLVLVTGPTGSGKTTTLYSALKELNQVGSNISTIEDPIEYNLHGINQVQLREDIGLSFANALRSFLRQDPDIIMVGEMRDLATAEISIKAALTGHLVLSTLHTNDAASSITRLLNMGVEAFLISSTLKAIVAQRLVRLLCDKCSQKITLDSFAKYIEAGIKENDLAQAHIKMAVGCDICNGTGYKGRTAVYEVMSIDQSLKEMIIDNASTDKLKKQAQKNGMKTLRQSANMLLLKGLTSIEEVMRVTSKDD